MTEHLTAKQSRESGYGDAEEEEERGRYAYAEEVG